MRERVLALAVAGVLAIGGAACGGGDGEGGGTGTAAGKAPITVWSLENQPDRIAATQQIVNQFTKKTGIKVELVGIDSNQLAALVTSASAANELPDVMNLPLAYAHSFASEQITDPGAANEVVDRLGRDTFSPRALDLVRFENQAAAVPSDGWGQLLVYRKDLFEAAGLEKPDTYERIEAAARALNRPGRAGIVASTTPDDLFTEESFEHFALANGCQLTDGDGQVTIGSAQCAEAFDFYTRLVGDYSVKGTQDVDTTRAAYFAGQAAMVVWSAFLLDELAGLRNDALPSCRQCTADPTFLAKNSGIVTTIEGPRGEPAQYGEISTWAISDSASKDSAKAFVEYMLSDGLLGWVGQAPEGKFPLRAGTAEERTRYADAWATLQAGVDRKAPLSTFYAAEDIAAVKKGPETFTRWGFEQGQGALVGAARSELRIARVVAESVGRGASGQEAARDAQSAIEDVQGATGG